MFGLQIPLRYEGPSHHAKYIHADKYKKVRHVLVLCGREKRAPLEWCHKKVPDPLEAIFARTFVAL